MLEVHSKVDFLEASTSPLQAYQPLAFMKMGGLDVAFVPEAIFAKKLCDLIASLEAASLGLGKTIGCLMRANASRSKNKKARPIILKKKSFKMKSKKIDAIGKTSTTV
jgi:hypothetical protein